MIVMLSMVLTSIIEGGKYLFPYRFYPLFNLR